MTIKRVGQGVENSLRRINFMESFMQKPLSSKMRFGSHTRLALLSLFIMLVAGLGCDALGCGSGSVPGSASDRVTDMAEHLPKKTQMSFVVGDLAGMRASLETARDTVGDMVPTDLIQEQAKNELGIDVFNAESWKKSGIAENGGLTLSVFNKRPVLVTYVTDKQKFEKAFADQLKKSMGLEGAAKSQKVDGATVKTIGSDDQTVAWAYDGKLVVAVFPVSEDLSELDTDGEATGAKKAAATLAGLDSDKSLASVASYNEFNAALASEQSMAVFINTTEALTEERMKALEQSRDMMTSMAAPWVKENVDAIGLSMHVESNTMKFRTWADLPEKVAKRAQEIMTPTVPGPIESFATENTMAALRTSVDMPKLWAFYKETLPKDQREQMLSELEGTSEKIGIDVEKDIINQLTGNLGVLFYGVDQSVLDGAGGNVVSAAMMQPFKLLAVMVPLQFKDKASLEKVVSALNKTAGGMATRSKVKGDVEVLKMKNVTQPRGQVFLQENLLVYATNAFSDDSVYQYITGERKEKNLTEADKLNLGKELAAGEKYNGLYVNFVRAQKQLGDVLAKTQPQAAKLLKKIEEAALTMSVTENGAFVDLTIDLAPNTKKVDKKTDKGE
jgi:hypothetical protein